MDWMWKAVVTAAMVLIVMGLVGRAGQRLAGVVAALPTITAPTLAWLVHERGVTFAVDAAIGSVSACAMLAIFALGYALASRRVGSVAALLCGLVGALALAFPALVASSNLADALTLALGCSTLALASISSRTMPAGIPRLRSRRSLVCVAVATGSLTALAATIGPKFGGFATGLLSSLPLITGAVVVMEHAAAGPRAAEQFLHGYVWGLFGKAAFGAVFALLAMVLGAPLAMVVACVVTGLMSAARISRRDMGHAASARHSLIRPE
jgi:hypothetical protein